ncbi:TadE/TadG family type IV pilus assembly protein [Hyalangium rubrum]|uniref:TadE/TadG family type IV pilus assembly protein n=1 Tax=Hyalangium rubrum TaxID=3103134 RepID=A0ABU5H7H7_9BACT|nr:TadE/TadG family type IV pilus assembly protein [Hyalangium sp. s54d21]MDY7229433.1 TadE/TadG family type IV pilus assembly protein [Hyalangium sp. s54d21]
MRLPAQRQYARRGAATVEFAIIVPVLVTILMFSMYLTELVRAKIKLQEFSRYVVFEMTSYTLSDFANAQHDQAFTDAQTEMMEEAVERYKDLDSVEPNAPGGNFVAKFAEVAGTVQNKDVPFIEAGLVLGNANEGFASDVLGAINGGANGLLSFWRFNTKGWVETEVTMKYNNAILPESYLDQGRGAFFKVDPFGGKSIASLELKQRFSMYADPWNMEDGGDATIRGRRAGAHRAGSEEFSHGLYRQVNRMVFLGVKDRLLGESSIISDLGSFLAQIFPAFLGTFVVSHNYTANPTDEWDRECIGGDTGIVSYPAEAQGGLNNLDKFSQLDHPRPKCFDTAPFRDQPYERSQYIKIFQSRGDFFMGCKNAQANDPSAPQSTEATQRDESKTNAVNCE